jgi:hypothetical protein
VLAAQNQPLGGARGAGPKKAPDNNAKQVASRCREANKYPRRRAANFDFVLSIFLCDSKEIFSRPNFNYSDSLILNVSIQYLSHFSIKDSSNHSI